MGSAIFILLVGLVATGSAKPYEPSRKSSSSNQYLLYPYDFNVLYPGSGRISDEYLNRLLAERPGNVPFVSLGDKPSNDQNQEEERVPESVDSQKADPSIDSDVPKHAPESEDKIDKEQPKSNPEEQKEAPTDKPSEKAPEIGRGAEPEEKENPEKQPKEGENDVDKSKENESEKRNESKENQEPKNQRPQPEQSLKPRPNSSSRNEEKQPKEGRPRFHPRGKKGPRGIGPVQQPGTGRSREAVSPLVQINVNVAN